MTQACEELGYPRPVWQEFGAALRVIFQPHPATTDKDGESKDVPANETNEAVNEAIETPNEPGETINEANEAVNETANEAVNARQQWFIAQISAGRQPGWVELAEQWQVSRSTAQRDIAGLKARGLIEFVGAPKTGFYRIVKQTNS